MGAAGCVGGWNSGKRRRQREAGAKQAINYAQAPVSGYQQLVETRLRTENFKIL